MQRQRLHKENAELLLRDSQKRNKFKILSCNKKIKETVRSLAVPATLAYGSYLLSVTKHYFIKMYWGWEFREQPDVTVNSTSCPLPVGSRREARSTHWAPTAVWTQFPNHHGQYITELVIITRHSTVTNVSFLKLQDTKFLIDYHLRVQ